MTKRKIAYIILAVLLDLAFPRDEMTELAIDVAEEAVQIARAKTE